MTPLESIHSFCTDCVGSAHELTNCGGNRCGNGGCDASGVCLFYPYRHGRGRPSVKTIRRICLWCQGDRADFVRECREVTCVLHPYRMGSNPNRAGMGSKSPFKNAVSRVSSA